MGGRGAGAAAAARRGRLHRPVGVVGVGALRVEEDLRDGLGEVGALLQDRLAGRADDVPQRGGAQALQVAQAQALGQLDPLHLRGGEGSGREDGAGRRHWLREETLREGGGSRT